MCVNLIIVFDDNDSARLNCRRKASIYRLKCDRKPGGPSRKCCSNIFNEPPWSGQCLCWWQLAFFVFRRSERNYKWKLSSGGGFETRFQLTGRLLDGKWRLVRGHRANGIDNKQELQRAVRLSDYQRSLAWYGWFIGGSRLVSISHLITKIMTRDDECPDFYISPNLRIYCCISWIMDFVRFLIEKNKALYSKHRFP